MTKTITILGSTGSVGQSTIDVISKNPDEFQIHALTAYKNVELLSQQARKYNPKLAVIGDEALFQNLKDNLYGTGIECAAGTQAIIECASIPVDVTMAAIMGMAGLKPILVALKNGKSVAIANKEPLVSAGALVMDAAKKSGARILPVDSEHNAIFQCLELHNKNNIRRIILTASGGPFRTWSLEQMTVAKKEQALAHPNWSMGQKISIDSATMMNKALEVIEAHYLFDMPPDKIDVVVHPQSIIHSMVEYSDGSILAQMGASDMKTPISHALAWPKRLAVGGTGLNIKSLHNLSFEGVDHRRFPAINLGYQCLSGGARSLIAMNAANEIAVESFLNDKIGFMDIVATVEHIVESAAGLFYDNLACDVDAVIDFDARIRTQTMNHVTEITNKN